MSAAEAAVSDDEAAALFADFLTSPSILLAVSGGPDSTALLVLAARWRERRKEGPALTAVTVDHGLRPSSTREAAQVRELTRAFGIPHRTVRWLGEKPTTGIQAAARKARYGLLAQAARNARATHILTAHTRDDQAETVLWRLLRGSGVAGLAGMARLTALDADTGEPAAADASRSILLARPFLGLPKARLIATLDVAGIGYAEDPSNIDPRYARTRLRRIFAELATEGFDPDQLTLLAERARRAEEALQWAADHASPDVVLPSDDGIRFDAGRFAALPLEIGMRLVRSAIAALGDEGDVELAKLEALMSALRQASSEPGATFRRTLAGAAVTAKKGVIAISRAPARRPSSEARRARRPGGA